MKIDVDINYKKFDIINSRTRETLSKRKTLPMFQKYFTKSLMVSKEPSVSELLF